jgi:hypothetical protein
MTVGYAFDVELLMRARLAGVSVAEVPVFYRYDSDSRVRLVSASWRMLRDVLKLSYRLRDGRRPSPRTRPPGG